MRENPEDKLLREKEAAISFAHQGSLIPLERVSRNQPWVTQGVIADSYKSDFRSIMKRSYDKKNLDNFRDIPSCRPSAGPIPAIDYPAVNPDTMQLKKGPTPQMLTAQNIEEIEKAREATTGKTDFMSTLLRHKPGFNRINLETTYLHSYCQQALKPGLVPEAMATASKIETFNSNMYARRGLPAKKTKLVSEKDPGLCEPKSNLTVQKTWLPVRDPAFLAVKRDWPEPYHPKDIMTSLPLD